MTRCVTDCRGCNRTFESRTVPEDWKNGVIVPLRKSKGEKADCKNYRSIISIMAKKYERILRERVRRKTDGNNGRWRDNSVALGQGVVV